MRITERKLRTFIRKQILEGRPVRIGRWGRLDFGDFDRGHLGPTATRWAEREGLDVGTDNDGQLVIFATNRQADMIDLPREHDWQVERDPDGHGWTIYTGEYE
jgi:hypothetical protein